jgi:hypothetical protein
LWQFGLGASPHGWGKPVANAHILSFLVCLADAEVQRGLEERSHALAAAHEERAVEAAQLDELRAAHAAVQQAAAQLQVSSWRLPMHGCELTSQQH